MGRRKAILALGLSAGLVTAMTIGGWRYAERTRVIEGTWLYMFEGSSFFEQQQPGHECDLYRDHGLGGWLNYELAAVDPRYRSEHPLPNTGLYRSRDGAWPLDAFEVRFIGRKRLMPWGGGHLGLWKSEYDVDQMLSVKAISGLSCEIDQTSRNSQGLD